MGGKEYFVGMLNLCDGLEKAQNTTTASYYLVASDLKIQFQV